MAGTTVRSWRNVPSGARIAWKRLERWDTDPRSLLLHAQWKKPSVKVYIPRSPSSRYTYACTHKSRALYHYFSTFSHREIRNFLFLRKKFLQKNSLQKFYNRIIEVSLDLIFVNSCFSTIFLPLHVYFQSLHHTSPLRIFCISLSNQNNSLSSILLFPSRVYVAKYRNEVHPRNNKLMPYPLCI